MYHDKTNMTKPSNRYIHSYYADTLNDHRDYQRLSTELSVETCIVGGGYAGLMTAIGLIERGQTNVAVLEQHDIGWGASGRNGGFVFGGYSLGPRALVKRVGEAKARDLYQFTTAAVELIRQRVQDYQISCDLVDEGVIWANWFKDQQLLLKEQAFMREVMGIDWAYWSPEVLAAKLVSDRYHGGLFEKNAMHFHPLNYARGISRQIELAGGQIFTDTRVLDIDDSASEKVVRTESGLVRCKNVVIAGGGYIGSLCPPVARSILPIATYVMTTQPLGEQLNQVMKTRAAVYDTRFAFDYYRPLNDSRLLWGGRISARKQTPPNLKAQLREDMLRVFPGLGEVQIESVWDGWMGYSRHQMAQIGQLKPGVWYSIGFGGHGVGPTTAAGEIVAAAIAEQDESYRNFQPWGLPWNGGLFGPPAAQVSYWWYQLKDWLKERLER
jgi:gamma-glutamylputrescine oxidase